MRISTSQISSAGIREMLARQSELRQTQLQLSVQKRVLKPSDDPVAATAISFLRGEISQFEQFGRNTDAAKAKIEAEETVLSSTTNILFRVKELMVSLGNGTLSENEFNAIKVELEIRREELLGLANSRNANGEYLFSGSRVREQPFVEANTNTISYRGDQNQRMLRISSGSVIAVSDSGFDVFVDVKNGNGKFTTSAVPANIGTGVISTGSYSAPPNFLPEPFDLTFAVGGGGQLEYTITGRVSGAIVAGPTTYQDGTDITFSGVSLNIAGAPSAGDAFAIEPSTSQDLFTSLQNVIDAVDSFVDTAAGRAELTNKLASEQSSIDRGMTNIDRIRAKIGSRLNAIDSEEFSNLTLLLNSKSALSDIEDLDIIEASTRLSQQVTVLEAAQASYIRVQGLSLFNFL